MRTLTLVLAASAAVATTATVVSCVKVNAFKCDGNDSACGANGQCELDGFCSVPVPVETCPSGRQYSDTAGDLANQCVGGGDPTDGPLDPDGPPPDGQPSDSSTSCEGYETIANGQTGHKYKFISTPDEWSNQHNIRCTPGAYLAIPDSAAELAAMATVGGSTFWVGVTDGPGNGDEGSFKDVLDVPYDPQARVGMPIGSNAQNKDCVKAVNNGTALDAESCTQNLVAVCECEE